MIQLTSRTGNFSCAAAERPSSPIVPAALTPSAALPALSRNPRRLILLLILVSPVHDQPCSPDERSEIRDSHRAEGPPRISLRSSGRLRPSSRAMRATILRLSTHRSVRRRQPYPDAHFE